MFWIRYIAITFILILASISLVGLSRQGLLPAAPDEFTYDWRTYLLAERPEKSRDDIILIQINEDSLRGYPYLSPIDRSLTAELLRYVADSDAKAVALDGYFVRPTEEEKDRILIDAVKYAQSKIPTIVGVLDNHKYFNRDALNYQNYFLKETGATPGHIYLGTKQNIISIKEDVVRYQLTLDPSSKNHISFAQAIAQAVGTHYVPSSSLIYWRHPQLENASLLFKTLTILPHRTFKGEKSGDVVPKYFKPLLKGKIVLIGAGFEHLDNHLTPFSVAHGKYMKGLDVHAQILAQILDKKSLYEPGFWHELAMVLLITVLGFVIAIKWGKFVGGWVSSLIALVVLTGLSFLLFGTLSFILPSSTLFVAWPIGLLIGELLKTRLVRKIYAGGLS